MKRWKKFQLFKEFGLCEVLSQIEPMAVGTLGGDQILIFLPFLRDKRQVPFRLIQDGRPAQARIIRESKISNIRMLTAEERAEWLRISLELRAEWKTREAEEAAKAEQLASV